MNKFWITLIVLSGYYSSQAAQIDPALVTIKTKKIPVIALLQPNCLHEANTIVRLREQNNECSRQVANAVKITSFKPLWIGHAVAFHATFAQIQILAKNPLVKKVYFNHGFKFENSVSDFRNTFELPYSFSQIRLEQIKVQRPELDGSGQLIGIIDTGVDGTHDSLKNKIEKFFDADKNTMTNASDLAGHGTHVSGIMVADKIGVAPKAKIVSAKMLTIESALRAMQFIAEQKNVRVVNNSWGEQNLPDIEIYYRAFTVWENLGITTVFSAGNSGPNPKTITHPKEHPSTIVVGATNRDGSVATTSARGPGEFNGILLPKPELVAPGEKIISTLPNNIFGEWSGSSMAAPLVTGTIALMLQANPSLTSPKLREILISTAQDFAKGWDPNRGYGLLDATRAVDLAFQEGKVPPILTPMLNMGIWPKTSDPLPAERNMFEFPEELQGTWL